MAARLNEQNANLRATVESRVKDLETARMEALSANQAKSRFLANISHEIRTPLNGLLGALRLMDDTDLNQEQRELANIANASGEALFHLVADVLDLSQVEAGELQLKPAPFRVRELLDEVRGILLPIATGKGIGLVTIVDETVPVGLLGDVARLRQIMINLAGNAVKFTMEGLVTLRASGSPESPTHFSLALRVRDTGMGMTAEELKKVFTRFQQGRAGVEVGGSGLGLAISSELALLMGGRLVADSTEGAGSEFALEVTLPVAAVAAAKRTDSEALDGVSILVVDDQAVNRMVTSRLLEHAGAIVITANDGAQAVDQVSMEPPDVILMDRQMPGMDGIEAATKIREMGYEKPIIGLTAHVLGAELELCLAAGMDAVLTKPVRPDQLIMVIRGYGDDAPSEEAPKLVEVDLSYLLQAAGGDTSFIAMLIDKFLADASGIIDSLDAHNPKRLSREVHRLGSTSFTMGAVGLGAHCRTLELALERNAQTEELSAQLGDIREAFQRARVAFIQEREAL